MTRTEGMNRARFQSKNLTDPAAVQPLADSLDRYVRPNTVTCPTSLMGQAGVSVADEIKPVCMWKDSVYMARCGQGVQ